MTNGMKAVQGVSEAINKNLEDIWTFAGVLNKVFEELNKAWDNGLSHQASYDIAGATHSMAEAKTKANRLYENAREAASVIAASKDHDQGEAERRIGLVKDSATTLVSESARIESELNTAAARLDAASGTSRDFDEAKRSISASKEKLGEVIGSALFIFQKAQEAVATTK